jgi:hypothetical protein
MIDGRNFEEFLRVRRLSLAHYIPEEQERGSGPKALVFDDSAFIPARVGIDNRLPVGLNFL